MAGSGHISVQGFLKSIICQRVIENSRMNRTKTNMYTQFEWKLQDLRAFVSNANIFDIHKGGVMEYADFKKTFFP